MSVTFNLLTLKHALIPTEWMIVPDEKSDGFVLTFSEDVSNVCNIVQIILWTVDNDMIYVTDGNYFYRLLSKNRHKTFTANFSKLSRILWQHTHRF